MAYGWQATQCVIGAAYRGDLQIDLIAPDGSTYRLKNSSSADNADNVIATHIANVSTETLNSTWKLRVADVYISDTGYINSCSITLGATGLWTLNPGHAPGFFYHSFLQAHL